MLRTLFLSLALLCIGAAPSAGSELGDDGLHKEDWFAITFRDIGDDIAAAKEQGKRLAIVFEQRGCVYCKKMHEVFFKDPEIVDYIKANFMLVQYNLFGDEEVTDLDGEELTEKTAARKWGFLFTPTIVFLPEDASSGEPVSKAAVAIMPGLLGKWTFVDMFHWVNEKGYEKPEHFQAYRARMISEREAAGVSNPME